MAVTARLRPGRHLAAARTGTGCRLLGLLGALLLAAGGLGAGGVLVHDPLLSGGPLAGWRYGYGRGVALALAHLGLALLVVAWLQLGRQVLAQRSGGVPY